MDSCLGGCRGNRRHHLPADLHLNRPSAYFTVAETSSNIQVPERTIRRWIRSKALPVTYDKKGHQLVLASSAEYLAIRWHERRGKRRARPSHPK